MNSADFASNRGEGDWSEEVYISTLLVCLFQHASRVTA